MEECNLYLNVDDFSILMMGAGVGYFLIGYFVSKGATEEEAEKLAKDVYRGEGIGFDQIRADLNKYRSGA